MQAVVRDVPASWLEERARLGLDLYDELWAGVLHMPPAPSREHQAISTRLVAFLEPILDARGLSVLFHTEVHRPGASGQDYRIPDIVFFREDQPGLTLTPRGLEGGPLAVLEVLSPNDETYEKFDFFADLEVAEIIVVKPESRTAEVYRLAGRRYLAVSADERERVAARSIGVQFSTVAGSPPVLRVECHGAAREL